MKKIILILTAFLILQENGFSQGGQSGMSFLNLGMGSRAIAMGEAYALDDGNPSGMQFNPVTIGLADNTQFMIVHQQWIQDTRSQFLGVVVPTNRFHFGLSFNSTSVGDIPIRTVPGPSQGTFTSRNLAVGLSTVYCFENFKVGLTGKFLYEKILVDEASGYAFDFGVVYKTPFDFNVALSTNNIGSMNPLRNESTTLPTTLRFSATKSYIIQSLNSIVTGTSDLVRILPKKKNHLHFGAEFDYDNIFALRSGIQTGYHARFFTTGLGFKYNIFIVDYAFVPSRNDFGSAHTFSITINL
jgi:hypothetical protein